MGILQTTLDKLADQLGYTKAAGVSSLFNSVGPIYGTNRLAGQRQQMEAYLDWVYAAASVVAKDAATLDLTAYANKTSKRSSKLARQLAYHPREVRELLKAAGSGAPALEELDNHILLDLLDNPNPFMDGQAFFELTFLHLQLAGEAFWAKIRNGLGKPDQLWPMVPYNMTEVPDPKKFIVGWKYRVGAEETLWDVNDVVHIKLTDPNNFYRGMSIVRAAARAIDTDAHAADWNRNFFQNSARPDFVLQTDSTLSDTVFNRLKEQWEDRHRGVINAHKIAILEAGIKTANTTLSQKDMDFLNTRKHSQDQILAMFGVSAAMLGLVQDANRANMEAADYNHAKRVVHPIQARLVSAVNHNLAPEYDKRLVIGFTSPVPEDEEFALKERTESINSYRTINEVREDLGLDPVPGGEVMYIPTTLAPLTAESATPPPTEPVDGEPTDPGDGGDTGTDTEKAHTGLRSIKKAFMTATTSVRS